MIGGKRKMKRIVAALTAALLIALLLCGCAENGNGNENGNGSAKKRVAFTFDDGPHAPAEDLDEGYYPYTTYVLDKLEALGMRATFFVVGERAEIPYNRAAIARGLKLGCEYGSHTYAHTSLNSLGSEEAIAKSLTDTENAIMAAGAPKPTLFRPVGGAANEAQLTYLSGRGYHSIYWSVDTRDWDGHPKTSQKGTEEYEAFVNGRVDLIMAQVKDGDIILMHDIYMSSVDIFLRAADRLVAEGYELVTVSELLSLDGKTAEPCLYTSKDVKITHAG